MPESVKEHVQKLRDEIAAINAANQKPTDIRVAKSQTAAERQRRQERLEEILLELVSLTEWKQLWVLAGVATCAVPNRISSIREQTGQGAPRSELAEYLR